MEKSRVVKAKDAKRKSGVEESRARRARKDYKSLLV